MPAPAGAAAGTGGVKTKAVEGPDAESIDWRATRSVIARRISSAVWNRSPGIFAIALRTRASRSGGIPASGARALGAGGVYDPVWGTRLADMPVGYEMMVLGQGDRYLYTFDPDTQQLHVMSVIPEPGTGLALLVGGLFVCRRRRHLIRQ